VAVVAPRRDHSALGDSLPLVNDFDLLRLHLATAVQVAPLARARPPTVHVADAGAGVVAGVAPRLDRGALAGDGLPLLHDFDLLRLHLASAVHVAARAGGGAPAVGVAGSRADVVAGGSGLELGAGGLGRWCRRGWGASVSITEAGGIFWGRDHRTNSDRDEGEGEGKSELHFGRNAVLGSVFNDWTEEVACMRSS
jgi:hypothetical protein